MCGESEGTIRDKPFYFKIGAIEARITIDDVVDFNIIDDEIEDLKTALDIYTKEELIGLIAQIVENGCEG